MYSIILCYKEFVIIIINNFVLNVKIINILMLDVNVCYYSKA